MDQCLQKLSRAWLAGEDILQGVGGLLATSFRRPEVAALRGSPDTISGHSGTPRRGGGGGPAHRNPEQGSERAAAWRGQGPGSSAR